MCPAVRRILECCKEECANGRLPAPKRKIPREAISEAVAGREDDFVGDMKSFGQGHGSVVRDDYELFVDAFRNRMFPGL